MSPPHSRNTFPARASIRTLRPSPPPDAREDGRLRQQVEYLVSRGWHAAIEHTEPTAAFEHYWTLWKLPLFGETDVDRILGEAESCSEAYPGHHVRLVGYDSRRQTPGISVLIYRGLGAPRNRAGLAR